MSNVPMRGARPVEVNPERRVLDENLPEFRRLRLVLPGFDPNWAQPGRSRSFVASRKRRRGSGGHPAKVAQRRERERARHPRGSREAALKRTVSALCQDAARCKAALEAELWASELLGSWWPERLELDADDADLAVGAPLVEEMGRRGDAAAAAALTALAEGSGGELGLLARECVQRLTEDGVPAPVWGEEIRQAQVTRVAVMREAVFDDGASVFIEATHGGEDRHAIGVYIDNNLGGMAKDILLADSIDLVEEAMRENRPDDGVLRLESMDPAEAGARVLTAIEQTDMTLDPPVGEDFARLRALALLRAYELPLGQLDFDMPEVSPEERNDLLEEFLASPEGEGIEPDTAEADVVSLAIDFCSGYVDGRPLRWSPVVVELFLADWLPRKVIAEDALLEAVPKALEVWVRYTGRRRAIPEWATALTVEGIAEWLDEMHARADDPEAAGPAKAFVAAAQEAGVNFGDEKAVASFIAGWNARGEGA
jgi:hypothetical protein